MTVLRAEASPTSDARGLPERALRRLRPMLARRLSGLPKMMGTRSAELGR